MENNQKVTGIAVGFLLYFAYVFLFSVIGNYIAKVCFSTHLIWISNSAMQWLIIGSVPLFITIGMYLFKCCEKWEIKGLLTGFVVWLIVLLAADLLKYPADDYGIYPALAGFLVMIGFYYLFKYYLIKLKG